ncbi:MAG: FAD:protein FMN transferase, partial [Planctomycetota bacterium]
MASPLRLTHVSHRAMATDFVAYLPPHVPQYSVDRALDALEELDRIEARLTVYRPDSDVSKINASAGIAAVRVDAMTLRLIRRSIELSRRSEGRFDITAGPLVDAWGFGMRRGRKPNDQEIAAATALVGYEKIEIDETRSSVHLPLSGMKINLGAIGKGFALDFIADRFRCEDIDDFLIHGGASSVIASGNPLASDDPADNPGDDRDEDHGRAPIDGGDVAWTVGVAHPTKPKRSVGQIKLRDAAMATSGSGKQFFHHRGKRYGHVIDPRSGYPAGELLSLTLITKSAT